MRGRIGRDLSTNRELPLKHGEALFNRFETFVAGGHAEIALKRGDRDVRARLAGLLHSDRDRLIQFIRNSHPQKWFGHTPTTQTSRLVALIISATRQMVANCKDDLTIGRAEVYNFLIVIQPSN